jgi:hypothetical protein
MRSECETEESQTLKELEAAREQMLVDLQRAVVRDTESAEEQARMVSERRTAKGKLKATNSAIKEAGGAIRSGG